MPRREQLLAMADEADRDAEQLEAQAALARGHASELRRLAAELEEGTITLTPVPNGAKVRHNMQAISERAGRKVGRPLDADHLFPAWLASINVTVTEWAAGHVDPDTGKPYSRARVKSWYAKGEGARPAPRHAVNVIEAESTDPKTKVSAVPATRKTWKNGIRE